jgi:hypothetical protein
MTDGPALLGKHCHKESSEHHSQLAKHPSSPWPITAHPSTPTTPMEPPSPVPTEIATDLPIVELTPKEHMLGLHAAGIKVRDFAYKALPNSCKAPKVSDPVPSLIAAEWQGHSPSAALAFQGVIPHLSSDHTTLLDAIRWVHVCNDSAPSSWFSTLSPPTFSFAPNVTPDNFKSPGLAPPPCPPSCPVTCMPHVTCPENPEA